MTVIGEDDTSYLPFLFKISVLSKTLHGLYDFSFVKDLIWANPLDLIQGVLTRFDSRTLHGLSYFDSSCVLLETLHGLCEL